MTPTPRTDALKHSGTAHYTAISFAEQLERELKTATALLTRCRNAAGRVEIGLYEDIQEFLHTQPAH